jgi:hypothetical protein
MLDIQGFVTGSHAVGAMRTVYMVLSCCMRHGEVEEGVILSRLRL